MENKKTLVEMVQELSFQELMSSYDIDLLDKCRRIFETTQEFEKCAEIRDRIKLIKHANTNNILK